MGAEPLLEQFAPGVRLMTSGGSTSNATAAPVAQPAPSMMPVHVPTPRPQPAANSNPAAAYPHPFAVRAALAASGNAEGDQPALPPGD